MSSFSVEPDSVIKAGKSVAGFGDQTRDSLSALMTHSGAAAGTSASDAVDGILSRFGEVMPQFAATHDAFSNGTILAGQVYTQSDQDVGGAITSMSSGS